MFGLPRSVAHHHALNRDDGSYLPGASCTKGGQRYPPDSDFFNRRKNA